MSLFKAIDESATNAAKSGEEFLKATKEYCELKVFQQLTLVFSYFCKIAIIGSLLIMGFVFFAIAGAIALGNVVGSFSLGCVIVGTLFCLISFIIYLNRKAIDKKIIHKLFKVFYD